MHVQPLCQEVDVPVMTKSSLRQQVYLTSFFFVDDWLASYFTALHEYPAAGLAFECVLDLLSGVFKCNFSSVCS